MGGERGRDGRGTEEGEGRGVSGVEGGGEEGLKEEEGGRGRGVSEVGRGGGGQSGRQVPSRQWDSDVIAGENGICGGREDGREGGGKRELSHRHYFIIKGT